MWRNSPNWYIKVYEVRKGPYSLGELKRLILNTPDLANCPVWCPGMDIWEPARNVRELRSACAGTSFLTGIQLFGKETIDDLRLFITLARPYWPAIASCLCGTILIAIIGALWPNTRTPSLSFQPQLQSQAARPQTVSPPTDSFKLNNLNPSNNLPIPYQQISIPKQVATSTPTPDLPAVSRQVSASSLTVLDDGRIIDDENYLEWAPQARSLYGYSEAAQFCESLNLRLYRDWRLPAASEVLQLVKKSRPDDAEAWYWTATLRVKYLPDRCIPERVIVSNKGNEQAVTIQNRQFLVRPVRCTHVTAATTIEDYPMLIWGIRQEHRGVTEAALRHGASPDLKFEGRTALSHAVHSLDLINQLLNHGANVYVPNDDGSCGLGCAMQTHKFEVMQRLLNAGAKVDGSGTRPPMVMAVEVGNFKGVGALIEMGADINAADEAGKTPLMIAAKDNQASMIELLLVNGADIDRRDKQGKRAIELAHPQIDQQFRPLLTRAGTANSHISAYDTFQLQGSLVNTPGTSPSDNPYNEMGFGVSQIEGSEAGSK